MCCEADCVKADPTDYHGIWWVCDYADKLRSRQNGSAGPEKAATDN